jgi:rhodanese-related sulfurtransferase
MGFLDYFQSVSTWTADEVREFLNSKKPEAYNLVDVRQSKEYESEHLPGARLIPISELPSRLDELDPTIPTIAY